MGAKKKPGGHDDASASRALPSVDALLKMGAARDAMARHGRLAVTGAIRATLADARQGGSASTSPGQLAAAAATRADTESRPSQRPVFNLTGTVLHTNVGRAILAEAAREAVLAAMNDATNLEFDVETGKRGERDDHVRGLLTELTGAEDAIAVNNNAAAVILCLNTLALRKDVIVSRGELVEIGGAFRMPDVMARAGAKLREVGATNRTHLRDYRDAIGPNTGAIMKVHTSNFEVKGFVASVAHREVATLAREKKIPFIDDLGSGALADLADYGLPAERMVRTAIQDGADLVTFSGDKILGGPQAGLIVGRRDLVAQLAKNPLKRALRLDRMRLAALEATLRLYRDPDTLATKLPTLRLLTRPRSDIRALAERLRPRLTDALGAAWDVTVADCDSETGSGALPLATIPSAGLAIAPRDPKGAGRALDSLAARLRTLPWPVLGRIQQNRIMLDLRCLEREKEFSDQLALLNETKP